MDVRNTFRRNPLEDSKEKQGAISEENHRRFYKGLFIRFHGKISGEHLWTF